MYLVDLGNTLLIFLLTTVTIPTLSQLATWSSVYESPIIKEPKPGWARFCKGDQVYDTFANQCPVGIVWNEEKQNIQWDCVCTRGPWRRSSGWCSDDDGQRFTQGDITCFKPDPAERSQKLQALYYVGDRFSAWDSSLPILLTDYRSGLPVRKGDLSVEWEIVSRNRKEPGILIYRPRDDWTVYDKLNNKLRLCLRAPDTFNEETEGLFMYNVSSLFNQNGTGQIFQLSMTRGCYSWREHDKIEWEEVVPANLQNKNLIVQAYNPKTASDQCKQCMIQPIPPPPEVDIDGGPLEDRDEFTIYDLKNVAVLKTEIDLQSDRLGQYWAHTMLQNGSDIVSGHFQELEILTRSAIMALDTCNSTMIPLEFYQYFLIMFRMLLSESFKKFPPKAEIGEQYYTKINELLNKCKDRKLDISFQLGTTCPTLYEGYINGSSESEQEPEAKPISTDKDYTSDKGRHDFLLEFIWRLNTFLHYKCFREFASNSVLLDVIQQQLESLFTEDLILRWYNPGASFQMYSLIFENHLNLESAMKNFQRCVAAVHDDSQYPGWLKRPIDRPDMTSKKGSSHNNRPKEKNKSTTRRKRETYDVIDGSGKSDDYYEDYEEIVKGPYNLFSGSAACVKSLRSFMMDTEKEAGPTCW